MLNGDVLTDVDVTAQLAQHEATGAVGTLGLVPVDDPSAYGLVLCDASHQVVGFLEKPAPSQLDGIDRYYISAGIYVLQRSVLEMIDSGRNVSIEREVWPALVGHGLYGSHADGAYWMDIGTPERYLQATFEILDGDVRTEVGRAVAEAGGVLRHGGNGSGIVHGPAFVGSECVLAADAVVGSRSVLGRGVTVGRASHIESSVILDGATVGAGTRITSSIIGPGVRIGEHCRVEGRVMLGEGVSVGSRNTLLGGMRIFPGVELPDGAIAF
jgi:mannose-1-phosphate guanylyltransferase